MGTVISGLEDLDRSGAPVSRPHCCRRLRALGEAAPIGETDEGRPVSGVVEYRPHADGTLQKEVRRYYRKDGTPKEQGPYWYFRYQRGRQAEEALSGQVRRPGGRTFEEAKRGSSETSVAYRDFLVEMDAIAVVPL